MNQDNLVLSDRYLAIEEAQQGFVTDQTISAGTPVTIGVFDGMGGEEHGEIAAFLAAQNAAGYRWSRNISSDLKRYCKEVYNYLYHQETNEEESQCTELFLEI